jgi:hypothetical protein
MFASHLAARTRFAACPLPPIANPKAERLKSESEELRTHASLPVIGVTTHVHDGVDDDLASGFLMKKIDLIREPGEQTPPDTPLDWAEARRVLKNGGNGFFNRV